jgi:hypothetical protein
MASDWYSIRVDLVSGRGEYFWPRPGRLMLASPSITFRQLADAINTEFARWDRGHLHHFILADGSEIAPLEWMDDAFGFEIDDSALLSEVSPGDQFAFEFDFGDGWEHLCTVGPDLVDPAQVYGAVPERPVSYFGWGDLPDQYGRRWADDDGESEPSPQPDPPFADLPPLLPSWGAGPPF